MIESELYAARNYDRGMWLLERVRLSELRRRVVGNVTGETLELGAGTGANAPHFPPGVRVTAIDLRPSHLIAAGDKARQAGHQGEYSVTCANAQELPFPDNVFDTVLGTLVFCSIANPQAALAEVLRVLRPEGQFILLEHVRGRTPVTRRLTDWLHPIWYAVNGVCHLNRETAASVARAGFRIDHTSIHARGLIQVIHATAPGEKTGSSDK